MTTLHTDIVASTAVTITTSIVVPIVIAAITATTTLLLTRASAAADRRRDHYAAAVATLVAWIEFPYRVRRRTDDKPETLAALASLGHDLQEQLACQQAWIATESTEVANGYKTARDTIRPHVAAALQEAWTSSPVIKPEEMNLGDWGPADECSPAIAGIQTAITTRFGYLPADLHLDANATVAEHLDFADAVRGRADRSRREVLLERFDLDPTRIVRELSTGNRRKVGIVLAMGHAPELLLLDEPTSGLDPLLQHQFHLAVQEAVADGTTVFLSSHVLPEVELLAQRVGILRSGRLVTIAAVADLRSRARQRLVLIAPAARPEDFAGLRGVVSATGETGAVHLEVDGSLDAVIKAASRFEVQRIVTHDNELEATFLDLYQGSQ
jgi:ABC-2 type transport system ATP-binding protein